MKFELIFLVAFGWVANGQDTCAQLADCLDKVKQAADSCSHEVDAFNVTQLAGTRFGECAPSEYFKSYIVSLLH